MVLLILWEISSFAQSRNISGKVTELNGVTLPGVSVVVKGTTTGTITDVNGNYSLAIGSDARILEFSYIGMKTKEAVIGTSSTVNITLEAESVDVDEVVVVGYGTQRRGDISGSVATVKTDELVAQPTSDLQGMLKGKVPGLYVTLSDARPGGSSNVFTKGD